MTELLQIPAQVMPGQWVTIGGIIAIFVVIALVAWLQSTRDRPEE